MTYHPVTHIIQNLLKENHCWFETFEHEPVTTSEQAAQVRPGYGLSQGAKALILSVKNNETDKRFIMCVLPGDTKLNSKKVKEILKVKSLRFATPEEVSQITNGVQIGGIPPFGNIFHLEVIADKKIFDNEKIIFNAGDRRFSIAMKAEDYKQYVNPIIHTFTL